MEGTSPSRVIRDAERCEAVRRWEAQTFVNSLGRGSPMAIIATGIDLAKNVFAVHGVDRWGKVVLRQPKVGRTKLNALMAAQPPMMIGMEACSGAH